MKRNQKGDCGMIGETCGEQRDGESWKSNTTSHYKDKGMSNCENAPGDLMRQA